LLAKQIEAWRGDHRGADIVAPEQLRRLQGNRDLGTGRDQGNVAAMSGFDHHIGPDATMLPLLLASRNDGSP